MATNAPPATNCYSAVLRRLLCSGSPPTPPSDHSFEPPAEENAKQLQVGSSINYPGVVARLMGLDSFPNSPSSQRDRTLGSFFRSRSASSIDFVAQFDPVKQHRRVRSSVSFREGMYYHEEGIITERGEKRNKNERRGGSVNSAKLNERRPVTKKNKKKKEETTKILKRRQNKSFGSGCKVHPHVGIVAPAADGQAKVEGGGVSPRRALPSKIGRSYSNNVELRVVKTGKKGKRRTKKDNYKESCYYKRMVEVICGLTDESVNEKWIYEELEDLDEVSEELGQEILQVLLKQFVDELVQPTLTMS